MSAGSHRGPREKLVKAQRSSPDHRQSIEAREKDGEELGHDTRSMNGEENVGDQPDNRPRQQHTRGPQLTPRLLADGLPGPRPPGLE